MTDEHMKVVEAMRDEFVRSDKHWGTPQFDTSACLGYAAALDHLLSVVKKWGEFEKAATAIYFHIDGVEVPVGFDEGSRRWVTGGCFGGSEYDRLLDAYNSLTTEGE